MLFRFPFRSPSHSLALILSLSPLSILTTQRALFFSNILTILLSTLSSTCALSLECVHSLSSSCSLNLSLSLSRSFSLFIYLASALHSLFHCSFSSSLPLPHDHSTSLQLLFSVYLSLSRLFNSHLPHFHLFRFLSFPLNLPISQTPPLTISLSFRIFS